MIEKKKKWKLADFDYPLPEKYIAQYPAKRRDQSKLMVIHKDSGEIEHKTFSNLPEYLRKNDLLILASIIEKEAGNDSEKDLIAGVFLKRLTDNMRLQADPTIIYGLLPNFDGDIKSSDIFNKDNKYNTYMIYGLPPTPIAISSKSSILAAFNASPGDYKYFVANSPTSHYFSKTYDEHLSKIKELGLDK